MSFRCVYGVRVMCAERRVLLAEEVMQPQRVVLAEEVIHPQRVVLLDVEDTRNAKCSKQTGGARPY